jgi:hypothetical protein
VSGIRNGLGAGESAGTNERKQSDLIKLHFG